MNFQVLIFIRAKQRIGVSSVSRAFVILKIQLRTKRARLNPRQRNPTLATNPFNVNVSRDSSFIEVSY